MFRSRLAIMLLGCMLTASVGGAAENAPDSSAASRSSLGVRQKRVEHMLLEMERKFKSLAQTLQESEPERADKLILALQESKKLLIADRMSEITRQLDAARLDSATTEQQKILDDVRRLIRLLLDEDEQNPLQEWEQLQVWKGQLEDLQNEQRAQRRESEKQLRPEAALADLDAQIAAVKALLEKQQQLQKETADARPAGPLRLEQLAPPQEELRQQTKSTADQIAAAGETREGQPTPADQAETTTPADPQATDPSGDSTPADQPQNPSPSGPPESGQQALENAARHQQGAAAGLQQGQGASAADSQQKAVDEIKKALDELESERRRVAMLPPEAKQEAAKKQEQTADKTARLAEEMQKNASSSGSPGEPGMQSPSKKKPGQKHVEQAQKAMEKAAGDLQDDNGEQAAKEQEEAIRELQKAIQEIEKRLAQLREETQVERLARLEQRFREMHARQQAATAKTVEMEKLRQEQGDFKRGDRLLLAGLAKEERELAEMAYQAYDILVEDGVSVVFPSVVDALRVDLEQAAGLLEERQTDEYLQTIQQEIETTLVELVAALEKAKREQQEAPGEGGGGGQQQQQALLPNSAELKLLKAAQQRINRLTQAFEKARGESELDASRQKQIESIARRQEEIAGLAERILRRMQEQTP